IHCSQPSIAVWHLSLIAERRPRIGTLRMTSFSICPPSRATPPEEPYPNSGPPLPSIQIFVEWLLEALAPRPVRRVSNRSALAVSEIQKASAAIHSFLHEPRTDPSRQFPRRLARLAQKD